MAAKLHWIVGPARAAVRSRESRVFSLWPRPSELGRVPMGLHMSLARPDDDLYSEPTATRALVRVTLPAFRLSTRESWSLVLLFGAILAIGVFLGQSAPGATPMQLISEWDDLLWVLLGATLGFAIAAWWEAGVVAGQLDGDHRCLGLGRMWPTVEPVVWRLGVPGACAWLSLLGPVVWSTAALTWSQSCPALGSGFATGSILYVLRISLPLIPGPTTRILESLLRVPDFSRSLRWALTTQFLPAGQQSATRRASPLIVGVLGLALWIAAFGLVLQMLAWRGDLESTAASMVWGWMVALLALIVALWVVDSLVRVLRYAFLFKGRVERRPVTPSEAALKMWSRENAVTNHVPSIADLPWEWSMASAGTLLVRQGDSDRTFHWLASGEARVVSRDSVGDVHQLATLRGGSGVGEMAFLDDQPRTADVVISRPALVASLSYEDSGREISDEDRDRFRDVVLAGQAFGRARVFRGCPSAGKERWIRCGVPKRYPAGQLVISEGDTDRWMALLVQGEVEVQRAGEKLADLGPGNVFGEVAFLHGTHRSASLIAKSEALLWSWEPEWLDAEVDRNELRPELEALAEARGAAR